MPTIKIPAPFRTYTAGTKEVPVQGETAAAALEDLLRQYPELRPNLFNPQGRLRPHINLFLEGINLRDLQGLETPLEPAATLRLVPSIAGG